MATKEEITPKTTIPSNPVEENKAKLRGQDSDLSYGAIDRTASQPVEANMDYAPGGADNPKTDADTMMETSKGIPTTVDRETEGSGAKRVRERENIRGMLGIVSQDEYTEAEKTSSSEMESRIKAAVENGDSFTAAYLDTIKDGYKGKRQKELDQRRVTAGRNLSSLASLAQTLGQIGVAASGGKVPTGKSASEVNNEVTRRLKEQYSAQEREDMKAMLQMRLQGLQSQILEARSNRKMAAAAALQGQEHEFKAGLAQFDANVKITEGNANRASREKIARAGNQATLGAASIRANSKGDDPYKDMVQLAEGLFVHKNQKDAVIAYGKSRMNPKDLARISAMGLNGSQYDNEQMVIKAIQQDPALAFEIRQKFGVSAPGGGYGGGRVLGNVNGTSSGKIDLAGTERKK